MEHNAATILLEHLTSIGLIGRPDEFVLNLYQNHGLEGARDALIVYEDCIKFVNKHVGTEWNEDYMIWLEQDAIVGDVPVVDVICGYPSNCIKFPVRASLLDSTDRSISLLDLEQRIKKNARAVIPCTAEEPGIFLDVNNQQIGTFWEEFDEFLEQQDNG